MTKPATPNPTTAFELAVAASFPGAVPSRQFLDAVQRAVEPIGFERDNTLPLVSICRDELTTTLFDQIEEDWGLAFTLAGLGGIPALGRTGWGSALSHIPDDDGRGCLLLFGFPHIGIEADGTIGVTVRTGQTNPTATCGALSSILEASQSGHLPTAVDVDDYEATKLALRLVDPHRPPTSLVELTMSALDALEIDLWKALDEAEVWRDHDVAVFCGVQIHAHGEQDWVWPRDAWYATADSHRRRLSLDI